MQSVEGTAAGAKHIYADCRPPAVGRMLVMRRWYNDAIQRNSVLCRSMQIGFPKNESKLGARRDPGELGDDERAERGRMLAERANRICNVRQMDWSRLRIGKRIGCWKRDNYCNILMSINWVLKLFLTDHCKRARSVYMQINNTCRIYLYWFASPST
jgi:hypothetical protein